MSVVSRILLAGLICAGMAGQALAAPLADEPGTTRGRLLHASKCVLSLGLSGGCDKDQADSKVKRDDDRPAEVKVADEHSTRHQFANASKCVMSFGFIGHCDKNEPDAPASAGGARADAAPAAPDDSTRGQFKRASACVLGLGFVGGCDKK